MVDAVQFKIKKTSNREKEKGKIKFRKIKIIISINYSANIEQGTYNYSYQLIFKKGEITFRK